MVVAVRDLPESISRLGLNRGQLLELADGHTLTVQAWLSSRSPAAEQFRGLGVVASSSGLGVALLNLALGACYSPQISDEVIAQEVEATKEFFAQRKVPWLWWVGPTAYPADIPHHLANHGLTGRCSLPAMVAPLPAPRRPLNPAARVWQAADLADLEAASRIRRTAFGFPPAAADTYFEDMAPDWLRGDPARLYLARLENGPPAAIGALIIGNDCPGVYAMATLPEFERRGLGSAILDRILSEAAVEGYRMAVLTAGSKGYPLYRKFGFVHLYDYQEFWVED